MLIRDPEIATVRNAMREEAVSAQFFLPDSHDFMEEAGDLAEKFCEMLNIPFVRRKITWPARMQIIEMEPKLMLEAGSITPVNGTSNSGNYSKITTKLVTFVWNLSTARHGRISSTPILFDSSKTSA